MKEMLTSQINLEKRTKPEQSHLSISNLLQGYGTQNIIFPAEK